MSRVPLFAHFTGCFSVSVNKSTIQTLASASAIVTIKALASESCCIFF